MWIIYNYHSTITDIYLVSIKSYRYLIDNHLHNTGVCCNDGFKIVRRLWFERSRMIECDPGARLKEVAAKVGDPWLKLKINRMWRGVSCDGCRKLHLHIRRAASTLARDFEVMSPVFQRNRNCNGEVARPIRRYFRCGVQCVFIFANRRRQYQ